MWITKLKRIFSRWKKLRERRTSTPTLTSLGHQDKYFQNDPHQGYEVPTPLTGGDDAIPTDFRTQSQIMIPHRADTHVQPLGSSPFPPRPDTTTPASLPLILITCPSSISSIHSDNVSPLIPPALPALPRLDTQIQRQERSKAQQSRHPHPHHPPLYCPSRPAPRPPMQLCKLLPDARSPGDEVASSGLLSYSCRRMASRIYQGGRKSRLERLSPFERCCEGLQAEGEVVNKRRTLCISSPVPGSFMHVNGAFVREEEEY